MTDESLVNLPVATFLERLASDAPTPGGGSVAALAGAMAAALGHMVTTFTIGKPKFASVQDQVKHLATRLQRAQAALQRLVDEDAAAYGVLSAALKLDKSDPTRKDRLAQAASLAGSVPLQTATLCANVLSDSDTLHRIGNPMLRADAEAAAQLARAGLHAAAANVRANLPLMTQHDARVIEEQLDALLLQHRTGE